MSSVPDLCAVCHVESVPPQEKSAVLDWLLEDPTEHPHFDPSTGTYIVPRDGLYTIKVALIPIGTTQLLTSKRKRSNVQYAIRIRAPNPADYQIESTYLDVGSTSLGQVEHLSTGTSITCERMPPAPSPGDVIPPSKEFLRITISCIQRKRKYHQAEPISKKELKRRKKRRRALLMRRTSRVDASDVEEETDTDSDWETGFESDTSQEEEANKLRDDVVRYQIPPPSDSDASQTSSQADRDLYMRQALHVDKLLEDSMPDEPPYPVQWQPLPHSSSEDLSIHRARPSTEGTTSVRKRRRFKRR